MQTGEPSACVWPQPAATEVLSPLSLTSFTEQAATRQLERLAGFRESVPMPRLPTAEATLAVPAHGDVALSGRALTDAGTSRCVPRESEEDSALGVRRPESKSPLCAALVL